MSELFTVRKATLDTILPANKAIAEKYLADMTYRGDNKEAVAKALSEAYAAGGVQKVNSERVTPITQEVLMRGWALEFGLLKPASQGDLPIWRTRSRKKVSVGEVAPNGKSMIKKYANADTYATGSWSEISSDIIEVDLFNPMFPNAAAENEAEANQEAAYELGKKMHTMIKTAIDAGIGAFGDDVWTYKDTDVVGLPTTNSIAMSGTTATDKITAMLKNAIIYFTGQGKANNGEVINLHISVLDEQDLWALAPLVQTGTYTPAQEQIFRNGSILNAYGHQFRIIPENIGIDQGYTYARVGLPAFELWNMDMGEFGGVQEVPTMKRKRAFFATQMVSILQPAPYKTNYCKIQFK
jgi:hypothetical protein